MARTSVLTISNVKWNANAALVRNLMKSLKKAMNTQELLLTKILGMENVVFPLLVGPKFFPVRKNFLINIIQINKVSSRHNIILTLPLLA